jgi:hypothetical protein
MDTRLSNYAVQWTGLALLAPAADGDVRRTDRGVDPWVAEAVGGVMDVAGRIR